MSSLINYKGLQVLDSASGAGGGAINTDLQDLADRIGPCNYTATTNPTTSDNTSSGYYAGSRWFNLTAGTEWVCLSSSSSTATWETTTLALASIGTAADLASLVPLAGQLMYADDTFQLGVGDGTTAFASLPLISLDNAYLPLTGGTVTGNVVAVGFQSGDFAPGGAPLHMVGFDVNTTPNSGTTYFGGFVTYQAQDVTQGYVRHLNIGANDDSDGINGGTDIRFFTQPIANTGNPGNSNLILTITRDGNVTMDNGGMFVANLFTTILNVATHTPSSSSDTGTAGTIAWDGSYIYVCTATNTWARVLIASW
jgi:hypothetical protein